LGLENTEHVQRRYACRRASRPVDTRTNIAGMTYSEVYASRVSLFECAESSIYQCTLLGQKCPCIISVFLFSASDGMTEKIVRNAFRSMLNKSAVGAVTADMHKLSK
jgi:hypothetical protein